MFTVNHIVSIKPSGQTGTIWSMALIKLAKTLLSDRSFQEVSQGPILQIFLPWKCSEFEQLRPAESMHSFTERLWQKEVSIIQKARSVPQLWNCPLLQVCIGLLANDKPKTMRTKLRAVDFLNNHNN